MRHHTYQRAIIQTMNDTRATGDIEEWMLCRLLVGRCISTVASNTTSKLKLPHRRHCSVSYSKHRRTNTVRALLGLEPKAAEVEAAQSSVVAANARE